MSRQIKGKRFTAHPPKPRKSPLAQAIESVQDAARDSQSISYGELKEILRRVDERTE